jgi:hypothetical protein
MGNARRSDPPGVFIMFARKIAVSGHDSAAFDPLTGHIVYR